MKKSRKTLLGVLAIACISLASCSSDEPMQQKNGEESGFRPRSTKFVNAKAAYFVERGLSILAISNSIITSF
jgi:uncharacterized lipoprotein